MLCVTVDCWDGPDGEPMVQHGYTLTSKITFKSVIETINKYAFVNNECVSSVFLFSFIIVVYDQSLVDVRKSIIIFFVAFRNYHWWA